MTQRLFFTHDQLTAELDVQTCTPHEDQFALTLLSTVFHPQGGGQPSDTGWIGESRVLKVVQDGEHVVHYVDRQVAPGTVLARVDEPERRLHTRLHSAGHLIGNAGETFGWKPVKAHHWPGEGKITFTRGQAAQAFDAQSIQDCIAPWIAADLPRHTTLADGSRQIGFGHLPAYACGGTHVKALGEIGTVTILAVTEKKGLLSVRYTLD